MWEYKKKIIIKWVIKTNSLIFKFIKHSKENLNKITIIKHKYYNIFKNIPYKKQ